MLKNKQIILFLLAGLLITGCSVLNPSRIRHFILHVEEELFSQATITMPVRVTSTFTSTPTLVPTATIKPSDTLTPTPTPRPLINYSSPTFEWLQTQEMPVSAGDGINRVSDVTIPDETVLKPGQLFIKSWRMTNSGDKTWEDGTKLMMDTTFDTEMPTVVKAIFVKENDWIDFTPGGWGQRVYNVGPGTQVDLAVILRAPLHAGSFQIQFRLVNTRGEIINTPFWMRFFVVSPTATPTPEPPTRTPVLPTNTPRPGRGTAIPVIAEEMPTPTPEPEACDWSGHWMVREPFMEEEILPANAWFYQSGEELTGFIYASSGDPIIVKGALFDKGRTFNGEIYYPWQKQTTAVVWRMQVTGDQFYAVTPLGVVDKSTVCGGKEGANLPDYCALPAGVKLSGQKLAVNR